MEEKWIEKAVEYRHNGHNCSQAVAHAIAEKHGLDADLAVKLTAGFGAGMGNAEGSCGALSAAILMSSMMNEGPEAKSNARNITGKFMEMSGAVVCKELKGIETGKVLCPCDDCVRNAMRAFPG